MEVTEYTPNQFDEIEKYWKILEKGHEMTAFQLFDWYKNINELYKHEKVKNIFRKWTYILVKDDDEPIMIAPIQVIKHSFGNKKVGFPKGFYFIGRQGYSDYLNFIYNDFSEQAALLIFNYIYKKYGMEVCRFEQLIKNTSLYRYITGEYEYKQWECYCAELILPVTFEEYKKSLSKSTRQNIRTAINRQNRDEKHFKHKIIYSFDDEMLKTLEEIRAGRLKEKQKKSAGNASVFGKIYGFLRKLIILIFSAKHDVLRNNCNPLGFIVTEGQRIVSYFWGIMNDYKNEYYVILAGVDKDYLWYSPSISHLYLFIEEQYRDGKEDIKVFDFTRGGERYKTDMGGTKKETYRVDFTIKLY